MMIYESPATESHARASGTWPDPLDTSLSDGPIAYQPYRSDAQAVWLGSLRTVPALESLADNDRGVRGVTDHSYPLAYYLRKSHTTLGEILYINDWLRLVPTGA